MEQDKDLVKFEVFHKNTLTKIKDLEIKDSETLEIGSEILKDVRNMKLKIEETRKFYVKPLNDQVKKINERFKKYTTGLIILEKELKTKIVNYQNVLITQRKKILDEQNEKYRKEVEVCLKEDKPIPPPPVLSESLNENELKGMYIREDFDFEIVDIDIIPEKFQGVRIKIVDEKAVRKLIRAGIRDIPGIRIFKKEILAVRSENNNDNDDDI